MKNIAIIYNICELQRQNTEMYISHIESILKQDYPIENYKLVISGCGVTEFTKNKLIDLFKEKCYFVFYNEPHKCIVTFNKTVELLNKYNFNFDEYMYVASDVNMINPNCLKKINSYSSDQVGIIQFQVDTDAGLRGVNEDAFNNIQLGERYLKLPSPYFTSDQEIKVGYHGGNLHCLSFNSKIYNFYKKILPDIFFWCPEEMLVYLSISLKLKFILTGNILLLHLHERDGTLANGDKNVAHNGPTWKSDPKFTNFSINEYVDDYAKSSGFGFNQFTLKENTRSNIFTPTNHYLIHDKSLYNDDGFCKNFENLQNFIKNRYYGSNFNYDNINCEFIK